MRHRNFNLFLILTLGVLCAIPGVFRAVAQQRQQSQADKPAPVRNNQAKNEKEEEPVAITPRVRDEKMFDSKPITTEDFGNFRYPVINGTGEVAFLALFPDPKGVNNSGQSLFLRQQNGSWRITREGEKASNLPEAIYGFSMPAIND